MPDPLARTPDAGGDTTLPAAWPPARLGGYRIVHELGHGGMGYVFEAADEVLARRVAVKVLAPEAARRPGAAERFLREARAAAAVEHDHVVPVLHVGEDAGVPYLVMPLLKGESLADRLKRGALPVADVVRVGRDVAAGLGAAHARGLMHRDVKPANVWLDADTGRARVLDFGLARAEDGSDAVTSAHAVAGSPAYMAPEQIDGKPTPRSDLFALGATLYECATGKRAFEGPTLTAILRAVADHHPPPPAVVNPAVPIPLSDLIMRLLAKDPAGRPGDAQEVVAALAAGPVDDGRTMTWHGHAPRPPRSRRRWAWVAGAAALAAAAVAFAQCSEWRSANSHDPSGPSPPTPPAPPSSGVTPSTPVRYRGKVDVSVERRTDGRLLLLRLNEAGALPLRPDDKFRIEGTIEPAAYVYVVWVDPGHDLTPVYPWDPKVGWGSRPAAESLTDRVSLPADAGRRYEAPKAKPGVATIVLFARPAPLDVPDDVVKGWFERLPDLPPPAGGDRAAVWFDDYVEARDPLRLRTFGEVGSDDAFARWQGELRKALGDKAAFETAVSFARAGGK